jgi:hypothetical protein
MLGLAGFAYADIQLGLQIDNSNKGLGGNEAYDGREGGETIADAFPIGALPFADTGATCDNMDDYDETCPYSGSTSADVVYSIVGTGIEVDIDLCESQYDTKVYVYDFDGGYGFGNPYACNDDAGCGYSGYQSLIECLMLNAGTEYFIVVDGYGGSCGEYIMTVEECVPCVVECPAGAELEGEGPLVPNYIDDYNGGCNSIPQGTPWQMLCGYDGELVLCCNAGNYSYYGSAYRDTDWFIVYPNGDPMSMTGTAANPTYLFQLSWTGNYMDCVDVAVYSNILLDPCVPGTLAIDPNVTSPEIGLWGGAAGWENWPEYLYVLELTGISGDPTGTEPTTWSAVKSMFR